MPPLRPLLALLFLPLVLSGAQPATAETAAGVLARIQAPTFPNRDFDLATFGAKPGQDASDALRRAIAACHAAGGGRVVVPPGNFLTGPIHLRSHVNLHVSEGATLTFLTDPDRYLPAVFTRWEGMECMNYSPLIYALDQQDIAVTGKGTLDGGATYETWWAWNRKSPGKPSLQVAARNRLFEQSERGVPPSERVFGAGSHLRPNFIQPYRCRNVLVEGVRIIRSPMWEIHPVLCTNVTVRGVTIDSHGPNNDGCDPESCRDVLIEDCVFDTGDDCIAIKSGRNNDGRRLNVPSENIVIRRCTMKDGHGGVVIGSEISGGCRNVFVEDCTMDSPHLERGLRFKSNARRGGVIENVVFERVRIGRVAEAILTVDFNYEEGANGPFPPTVRHVRLSQVTSDASPRVMWVAGFPGATIEDIRFEDCTFRGVETAEVLSHAADIAFRRVTIEPLKKGRSLNSPAAPADAARKPSK